MRTLMIAVLGVGATSSFVRADSATINPDQDNVLCHSATGALSNGTGDIFIGGTSQSGPQRRGVVRFNIGSAGIPAGSTINSVTLRLYLVKTGDTTSRTIAVHKATASWGESTSYFNGGVCDSSDSNDATWIHRFHSGTAWAAAGGDYTGAASGSASAGNTWNTWHTWSSAGMKSDVQAWIATPASNHGWVLISNSELTSQTARRYTSREAVDDTGDHYPELVIDYTPPPGFTGRAAPKPTHLGGFKLLGERDLDGDGIQDLVLRDEKRDRLLGGHRVRGGLVIWEHVVNRSSTDPLAVP